ncbi:28S ribosomal protein S23, mitochondrial-like isoform X1 [Limulus polyphemus]|uniref:Small ribosomal subunit protein mS23 n=1 Tax=Limulus polyphemus TaxID=6850 RepID=A0ABM1TIS8_LIMPO|nr:28S ribosomal protein S23, mitochondrial-like isoform X1 [Limulus polyphemus]
MAGARLEKLGTIFSRATGLIRSGAMKEEDIPMWYNIYKHFPPENEPYFARKPKPREIVQILYLEDVIRAKFFKKYGSPGLIDLNNPRSTLLSERFVTKYQELEKSGNFLEDQLFKATEEALSLEGISFDIKQPQIKQKATAQTRIEDIMAESSERILESAKSTLAEEFQAARDKQKSNKQNVDSET